MKITPMPGKLLIEPCETKQAKGSLIIIPDTMKEKPVEGIVVAVGNATIEHGVVIPMVNKVGEKVLFSKYGGTEIHVGGHEYKLVGQNDVLAVIED